MYTSSALLALVAFTSTVHSHGAILKAVGDSGASQGFLVDQTLARNCTTISPCQQDSTIIRDAEITQNIVNSCGRTEINGNIDVGEQTENELAAGRVTTVTKGSTLAVTIHQVNADGAGPYECDLDETSNAAVKFTKLKVANNVPGANGLSQEKEKDFTINVQMPDNFNCIGASTGNICTVRCRNTAVAGPFGGCFAVQQTDGTGRGNGQASASSVDTAQTLQGISAQILQNQKDLPIAIAANQAAGAVGEDGGAAAISALLAANPNAGATATSTAAQAGNTAAAGNGNQNQNQNGNTNGKGNGRGQGKAGNRNGNGNQNANGQNGAANNNGATGIGQTDNQNANGQAGNGNANGNAQGARTGNKQRRRMLKFLS